MPIGPTLPPSAGKRKRDDAEKSSDSDSSDDVGPQLPAQPPVESTEAKKPRVVGPSMPPTMKAPPKTQATAKTDDTDSSDDDDFGPSLPSANDKSAEILSNDTKPSSKPSQAGPTQSTRDEWMTLAPSSGDWSQRVDPTKLKNRKFNSGMSATTSRSGGDSWHETPEQKQARLQREVLGVKDDKASKTVKTVSTNTELDDDTARRLKEYNKQRGPSLYEAHQKGQSAEAEDDPSARAFDREKDIGGGININASKRRDMLKKSANFDSRFSSAKYL